MPKNKKISLLFLTAYCTMLLNLMMHDSLCIEYNESVFSEYEEESHCHADHKHNKKEDNQNSAKHSAYCCGHFDFLNSLIYSSKSIHDTDITLLFVHTILNTDFENPSLPESNIHFQNLFNVKPEKLILTSSPLRAPPVA